MGWCAEGFGGWIIAAGEDEGVEVFDEIGDGIDDWGDDNGDASGLGDGIGVGHGEVGGGMIFSDHHIRSDGDDRFS